METAALSEHNRKAPELVTALEFITPELAKQYLELNKHNRPVSRAQVRELASDIKEGRYQPTHQGIAFSPDGELIDGQHRLLAIIEADTEGVYLLVTRRVDKSAWHVIDQHRRRTAGQVLVMEGMSKDAPRVATMARVILIVAEHADVRNKGKPTTSEVAEYVIMHREALERYLPLAKKFHPSLAAAFAYCEIKGWDPLLLVGAGERLVSMTWNDELDPMKALKKRSENFKDLGGSAKAAKDKFEVTLCALLGVVEKRVMKVIRDSGRVSYATIAKHGAARTAAAAAGETVAAERSEETAAEQLEPEGETTQPRASIPPPIPFTLSVQGATAAKPTAQTVSVPDYLKRKDDEAIDDGTVYDADGYDANGFDRHGVHQSTRNYEAKQKKAK